VSGRTKVAYLAVENFTENSAPASHVYNIVKGLTKAGFFVELFHSKVKKKKKISTLVHICRDVVLLLVRLRRFDIVYIRTHYAAFPVSIAAKLIGTPVIQEINGPLEDYYSGRKALRVVRSVIDFLVRKQLIWAQHIIVVSEGLREHFSSNLKVSNINVIGNAADVSLFIKTEKRVDLGPQPYVLFFGSFIRTKAIKLLARLVMHPEWPKELTFIFIGEGELIKELKNISLISDNIKIIGNMPQKELVGYISNSICTFSIQNDKLRTRSRKGLSPLKLYESLACECPVIVLDFPGQADLVRQYNCGIVVPPGDQEAVINAVLKLYRNAELRERMGKNGREAVVREHSWEKRALDTGKIIDRLVSRRN
jgi:glycosyltransferase involved in cell wall biosynthesis